ncbi:MAG TPA: hypothetical protein VGO62_07500, partial [Myxococcota bacterium]
LVQQLGPVARTHPQVGNFLAVLLDIGLNQAMTTALQYQDRNFGKLNEIADLVGDYVSASFAAGIRPRQDVIDGMRRVANTSGDYGNARLNDTWSARIAQRAGLRAPSADLAQQLDWFDQQASHQKQTFRDPGRLTQSLRGWLNRLGIGV